MTPIVADLSRHVWDAHGALDFGQAKAAGIVGVIYKVTEGATFQDHTYAKSRDLARAAGLLWGAFHFGTAAPVAAQIDNFFNTAAPDADTLVALDFEHNDPAPFNTMTGAAALEFLQLADARLGRPLTLYTGSHMVDAFGANPVPALRGRRLWWAQYGPAAVPHPTWNQYWLWQYTDGAIGPTPHTMNGFGACDLDQFDGTADDLRNAWIE